MTRTNDWNSFFSEDHTKLYSPENIHMGVKVDWSTRKENLFPKQQEVILVYRIKRSSIPEY